MVTTWKHAVCCWLYKFWRKKMEKYSELQELKGLLARNSDSLGDSDKICLMCAF